MRNRMHLMVCPLLLGWSAVVEARAHLWHIHEAVLEGKLCVCKLCVALGRLLLCFCAVAAASVASSHLKPVKQKGPPAHHWGEGCHVGLLHVGRLVL